MVERSGKKTELLRPFFQPLGGLHFSDLLDKGRIYQCKEDSAGNLYDSEAFTKTLSPQFDRHADSENRTGGQRATEDARFSLGASKFLFGGSVGDDREIFKWGHPPEKHRGLIRSQLRSRGEEGSYGEVGAVSCRKTVVMSICSLEVGSGHGGRHLLRGYVDRQDGGDCPQLTLILPLP